MFAKFQIFFLITYNLKYLFQFSSDHTCFVLLNYAKDETGKSKLKENVGNCFKRLVFPSARAAIVTTITRKYDNDSVLFRRRHLSSSTELFWHAESDVLIVENRCYSGRECTIDASFSSVPLTLFLLRPPTFFHRPKLSPLLFFCEVSTQSLRNICHVEQNHPEWEKCM